MPHDRNGMLLAEGDEVVIHAKVVSLMQGDEFCNVNLETAEPMYPGKDRSFLCLNTTQVVKLAEDEVAADSATEGSTCSQRAREAHGGPGCDGARCRRSFAQEQCIE